MSNEADADRTESEEDAPEPLIDERLLTIASQITDAEMEVIRGLIVAKLDSERQRQFKKAVGAKSRSRVDSVLASTFAPEFREMLISRYTDNEAVAVEHAILEATREDGLGMRLADSRESAQSSRLDASKLFIKWGIILILSNLIVLPVMAYAIAYIVEHPAADAINRLKDHLDKEGGGGGGESAVERAATLATNVGALSGNLAAVKDLLDDERGPITVPTSADDSINKFAEALDALKEQMKSAPAPASPEAPPPTLPVEQQTAADLAAMLYLREDRNMDRYWLIPKVNSKTDLEKAILHAYNCMFPFREASEQAKDVVQDWKQSSERLKEVVNKLDGGVPAATQDGADAATTSGSNGSVKDLLAHADLKEVGESLAQVSSVGNDLAAKAKAAVETLSATATFITPYTFAVLAIGAMFVSIGVASRLKSLRLVDERYDEAMDLHRSLMFARLACALRSKGAASAALVERLARIGERGRRAEGGVPLPLARAVAELVESFKK